MHSTAFLCGRRRPWPSGPGFGLDQSRAVLGHFGLHFLLAGDRFGPPLLGLGPGHARVGFGLVGLQAGADVLADVDVGDVDRDDLERRLGVEAAVEQVREMRFGFSITSTWSSAEPIDVMMPSPTRAMIVSSVAPPMSCARLVRTVTRALTSSSTPFLATALSIGFAARAGRGSR